jgi:RNA-binding protein YlmH
MDKKTFLNCIKFDDKNLLSNLYDKINLAEKTMRPVYTNEFLPPSVWKTVLNLKDNFDIEMGTYGVFDDCERKVMCFSKHDNEADNYPISVLKIINKSKFEKLEHKDYLGAIMALGIKREKYGDMILLENSIYAAVCDDVCEFLKQNLAHIGRCPCDVKIIKDLEGLFLSQNSKSILVKITSLRLDCVVSSICNFSRAKAVELLDSGKVLVNYMELKEKDKIIQIDDTLTIRGYGKYKVVEILGTTQKGKLKLSIKKYI